MEPSLHPAVIAPSSLSRNDFLSLVQVIDVLPSQIDKIIPLPFKNGPIVEVNKLIPDWVETNSTPESPIVIADCSEDNGFTASMLRDGVHPNAAGDTLIADQVGPLLIKYIKDVIAERGGGAAE